MVLLENGDEISATYLILQLVVEEALDTKHTAPVSSTGTSTTRPPSPPPNYPFPTSALSEDWIKLGALVGSLLLLGLPFLIMSTIIPLNKNTTTDGSMPDGGWIVSVIIPLFCFGLFCLGVAAVIRAVGFLFE